ncbi:hypothetical protein AUL39_08300 [Tractidigestivibacter scatoligenes]|uniref:Uncharacterized protein n=1 Tax=Tractidigestivibacter scatoligenes TaxID=1299998 RepID=A0A100YV16_TRASO|nr:hypothetical protein AUL39_08300 [Tractidigestivibacter scatoligenes]
MVYSVMTGKEKPTRIDDQALAEFTRRGIDLEHPERPYKDDEEIHEAFERMVRKATSFQR